MKSIFYKDLATPIFNSPLCGFTFGAAHHDICCHLLGMIAKGAAHRNINIEKMEVVLPSKPKALTTTIVLPTRMDGLFLPFKPKALTTSLQLQTPSK